MTCFPTCIVTCTVQIFFGHSAKRKRAACPLRRSAVCLNRQTEMKHSRSTESIRERDMNICTCIYIYILIVTSSAVISPLLLQGMGGVRDPSATRPPPPNDISLSRSLSLFASLRFAGEEFTVVNPRQGAPFPS